MVKIRRKIDGKAGSREKSEKYKSEKGMKVRKYERNLEWPSHWTCRHERSLRFFSSIKN